MTIESPSEKSETSKKEKQSLKETAESDKNLVAKKNDEAPVVKAEFELDDSNNDDGVSNGPARGSGDTEEDVSLTFPQRLMEILNNDEEHGDIISWLPHGGGFMIYNKKSFETEIMPKYFNKHSKYTSFTRKLNRWGFVRVTRGPEMGAYYHKLFKKGDIRLCMQMSCQRPGLETHGSFPGTLGRVSSGVIPSTIMQQGNPSFPLVGPNYFQMQQEHPQHHQQRILLMRQCEQMRNCEAMLRGSGSAQQLYRHHQQQLLASFPMDQALAQPQMISAITGSSTTTSRNGRHDGYNFTLQQNGSMGPDFAGGMR